MTDTSSEVEKILQTVATAGIHTGMSAEPDYDYHDTIKEATQVITKLIEAEKVKELERLKLKCWRQDTQMGDNPDTFAAVVFVDEITARIKELKGEQ